ncbi:MAG: ATP-binding protein [Bacilli bacterium]|nr:ATP-binding protein [Bacilli bacterium]
MVVGLLIPATCLLFSFFLNFVYFSKQRVDNKENKIYKRLIVINLISLIFEFINSYFTYNYINILSNFIVRIYLCLLVSFIAYMTCYMATVVSDDDKKLKRKEIIYMVVFFISAFFIFIFPLNLKVGEYGAYGDGLSTLVVFFATCIYQVMWLFNLITCAHGEFKEKKYIPFYIYLTLGQFLFFYQAMNPGFLLVTPIEMFVCLIMYFTIENPDVKMINELELAKNNAEKANQAKTEFLSSMSHEIRTPLNAIVGFSTAILEDENITEAQDEAKDIVMAAQNLMEIVNGILDISKIEAGKMEIVEVDYNLREMCDNIVKLVTPRILEKPIELKATYSKDLPGVMHGDMGKCKEIITNLLTNAAKYTDKGLIELSISCINKNKTSSLVISVEDTGRGIKPEKVDKLFTKFQRLEEDRNTTLEGTGLGLAITKSLVEMMGGKIIVQSKYGSGSKFTVYLNQKIVSMIDNRDKNEEKEKEEIIDYSKSKVLVVDDNKLNVKVASRMLKFYEIKADTCESGFECLDKVKEKEYDLILLDDMMPKMSGVETFKKLKEDKNFKVPVVMLTANAISGMKEQYIGEGLDDYLAKPIDKLELKRVLNKYLGKKKKND